MKIGYLDDNHFHLDFNLQDLDNLIRALEIAATHGGPDCADFLNDLREVQMHFLAAEGEDQLS